MSDEGEKFYFDQWVNGIRLNARESFISPYTPSNREGNKVSSVQVVKGVNSTSTAITENFFRVTINNLHS